MSQKGGLYRVRSLGFCETENLRYAIDIDNGTSIYQAKKEIKAIRQDKAKGIQGICSNSFAVPLLQQKVDTATEFSRDFPIAKFTYFTVRIDRMRVLKRVASPMEDRLLTAMKSHPCFACNAIRDKLAPKRLTRIRKMASWRGCCLM